MAKKPPVFEERDGYKLIYTRRIWHKHKKCYVYPKTSEAFRFWVKVK